MKNSCHVITNKTMTIHCFRAVIGYSCRFSHVPIPHSSVEGQLSCPAVCEKYPHAPGEWSSIHPPWQGVFNTSARCHLLPALCIRRIHGKYIVTNAICHWRSLRYWGHHQAVSENAPGITALRVETITYGALKVPSFDLVYMTIPQHRQTIIQHREKPCPAVVFVSERLWTCPPH